MQNTKFFTKILSILTLLGLLSALTGCGTQNTDTNTTAPTADSKQLQLFATTGYLADALSNIAPNAEITTLVGPGSDPHTYQPTTTDIEKMREADLVFWNGLHLEAQMIKPITTLKERQLAVGDALPKELLIRVSDDTSPEEHFDPHIWNDPEIWQLVVTMMAEKLAAHDPANAANYLQNASAYNTQIAQQHATIKELLAALPEPRTLVTGHDAFNYFGRTYNLKVYATDFISTIATRSAPEIEALAELISTQKIPAIFNDTQANPQAIKSLSEAVYARGWQVAIVDTELYADTLGAEAERDTYLEVLAHNAKTIAEALN